MKLLLLVASALLGTAGAESLRGRMLQVQSSAGSVVPTGPLSDPLGDGPAVMPGDGGNVIMPTDIPLPTGPADNFPEQGNPTAPPDPHAGDGSIQPNNPYGSDPSDDPALNDGGDGGSPTDDNEPDDSNVPVDDTSGEAPSGGADGGLSKPDDYTPLDDDNGEPPVDNTNTGEANPSDPIKDDDPVPPVDTSGLGPDDPANAPSSDPDPNMIPKPPGPNGGSGGINTGPISDPGIPVMLPDPELDYSADGEEAPDGPDSSLP